MQEKLENFNIRSDAHGQRHQSIDKPIVIWNVVIRESNFPSSIDYLLPQILKNTLENEVEKQHLRVNWIISRFIIGL